jgi:hypothetical protein
MQAKTTNTVRFELPDYKSDTRDILDGKQLTVKYKSSYGGMQTIEGEAEVVRELEGGRFRNYTVVAGRKIANGRVFSTADGRKVGSVESITVCMDSGEAIEWVAKDWNGHDVDTHDDEIYVQFWSGQLNDEMSQQEWMAHTDAIRFKHE